VADRARRLWAAGDHRSALSVVYQDALEQTRRRCQVEVPEAATEAVVLALLARVEPVHSRWCAVVAEVVNLWSQAAWAGNVPDEGRFEGALAALAEEARR
jgi:hypothetical protein